MGRFRIGFALAACAALNAMPIRAAEPGFLDGDRLWRMCPNGATEAQKTMCGLYVAGVVDELRARHVLETIGVCLSDASQDKATEAVRAYLRTHPGRRSYPAASLVEAAMALSFPCPKGPGE